jgi:electron transfer flavoprotein beta subunit
MNICVLIKQVPDPEARVEVVEGAASVEVEEKYMLNFFDSIAVEQALLLKEKTGGTVTAVSVGPKRAVEALRTAIAMGCDRAVRIDDPALGSADSLAVARALAAFLRKEPADIVLAGRAATDDEAGAVGPMVAGLLGIPHTAAVTELSLGEGAVTCTTEAEGKASVLELPFPALVTAEKGLCEPRVPQIMGVMKAMKVTPDMLDLAALGLNADDVKPLSEPSAFHPPRERPPVKMVEDANELARLLREDAKIM